VPKLRRLIKPGEVVEVEVPRGRRITTRPSSSGGQIVIVQEESDERAGFTPGLPQFTGFSEVRGQGTERGVLPDRGGDRSVVRDRTQEENAEVARARDGRATRSRMPKLKRKKRRQQ